MHLNEVDLIILVLFGLSMLIGLARGFVREVLSLLAWIAAFVVAVLFSGKVASLFSGGTAASSVGGFTQTTSQSPSFFALGLSFVCLFILTLIVGMILTQVFSRFTELSLMNRILGGIFGLARGYILVLIILFLVELTPLASYSAMQQSRFVPSFQPVVNQLSEWVKPGLASLKEQISQFQQQKEKSPESDMFNFLKKKE